MNNFYEAYGTLLYHRQLRALVALEREDWEFEPEYIDKMQFYLSEGVEHEDQMQMLQDLDCDCIQGFYCHNLRLPTL